MRDDKTGNSEYPVTYTVWLKRGGPATFQALSRTEAKREKRIYFHLQKDRKDREIFFRTQEIVGVTVEGKAIQSPSREELEKYCKANNLPVTPPSKPSAT